MALCLIEILNEYENSLCGKIFEYELEDQQIIRLIFYKESFCHLLGIQHVFDSDKRYLGANGYRKIESGQLTTQSMLSHNEKRFHYIKQKMIHFSEIELMLKRCEVFRFDSDKCFHSTTIRADYLVHEDKNEYRLHLFLREEQREKAQYAPVSFIVKMKNDKQNKQFIVNQKIKKVVRFSCVDLPGKDT